MPLPVIEGPGDWRFVSNVAEVARSYFQAVTLNITVKCDVHRTSTSGRSGLSQEDYPALA